MHRPRKDMRNVVAQAGHSLTRAEQAALRSAIKQSLQASVATVGAQLELVSEANVEGSTLLRLTVQGSTQTSAASAATCGTNSRCRETPHSQSFSKSDGP